MARPKSGKPHKQNLNITVDTTTRTNLNIISQQEKKSISQLVADWTAETIKKYEAGAN